MRFTDEIRAALAGARILHLDGTQYENALRAARLAKELGITVSLDACSMQEDNEKNWELASLADILIANEKYPRRLTGKDSVEEALAVMAKLGPKAFEQCAGFMRIQGGDNPLDGTSVHPESYEAAKTLLERFGIPPGGDCGRRIKGDQQKSSGLQEDGGRAGTW